MPIKTVVAHCSMRHAMTVDDRSIDDKRRWAVTIDDWSINDGYEQRPKAMIGNQRGRSKTTIRVGDWQPEVAVEDDDRSWRLTTRGGRQWWQPVTKGDRRWLETVANDGDWRQQSKEAVRVDDGGIRRRAEAASNDLQWWCNCQSTTTIVMINHKSIFLSFEKKLRGKKKFSSDWDEKKYN